MKYSIDNDYLKNNAFCLGVNYYDVRIADRVTGFIVHSEHHIFGVTKRVLKSGVYKTCFITVKKHIQ